jgi:thiol:disulfide interchange protein DsbC
MRLLSKGFTGALLVLSVTAAAAEDYSAVEDQIRALAPQAKSIAISETPIEGLLMVQINGDIVYATADGKYLIQGRVVDMETREDLTEGAKSEVRRELLAGVDSTTQITFAPEKPAHELMVFTDIDCGYCRKLHAQIAEYNQQGIAIHYMAFPRAGVGSTSYEKAVSVWCAADPREALTQAKLGAEPAPAQCENPIAQQYQLGLDLGVSGTPSLLTADGQMIPGYVPPDQLRERLDRMAEAAPK